MEGEENRGAGRPLITPTRATYFPCAGWYAGDDEAKNPSVRDPRAGGRVFDYTERHLQALWFDPRWRPSTLKTWQGEEVAVESPGNWNLEAGPDFTGASLIVGPEKRRITGDVEIHVFPSGWKQHGHHLDPRYRNVCLHLTYFEGMVPEEWLPRGALQIALRPSLQADPGFAFDHMDIAAYPYAGRAEVPPCRKILSAWTADERAAFLVSAGHARMRRKAARLFRDISQRGIDQVLYENIFAALGYQHNKLPFLKLSAAVPLDLLRSVSRGNVLDAYAVLCGASGLLPTTLKDTWDEETRQFVRSLWDVWWRVQELVPATLTRSDWRLNGIRPLNHPLRRLYAAAAMFAAGRGGLQLLEGWMAEEPRNFIRGIQSQFDFDQEAYWNFRQSLGGKKSKQPLSLIGPERWELIGLNIVLPLAVACGFRPDQVHERLAMLGPEPENGIIRQTAFYLLGKDYPSALLGDAVRRQGLQQIFHDYCLNDRSRCAGCALPKLIVSRGKPMESPGPG